MADELDDLIEQEERAKDLATELNQMLRGVESTGNKLVDTLLEGSQGVLNFNNLMKQVFKTMKSTGQLGDDFLEVNDLQKAMLKDAELFAKVQAQSTDMMNNSLGEMRQKVNDFNTELNDTNEVFEKSMAAVEEVSSDIAEDFDTQFKLLKRQGEQLKRNSANFVDIKDIIDNIGSVLRDPAKGAEGFLSTLSQFPKRLMEAKEATGTWGGALSKVWNDSRMGKFVKMIGKGGLIMVGIVALTAAAAVMWKLFKNFWEFMDKNIMPATAEFNKQIGGTGSEVEKLKGQTMAMGVQFELLGLSFEEGAAKVRELALGMRTVEFDSKTLKTGMELVSVLGLSGEEAGKAAIQFTKQTGSIDGLNEMMNLGAKEAKSYGVPVNQVLKDLTTAPDILARFGVANRMEFAKSATVASSYGLSIKEINSAFGKQMDTFDGTAESAAKLNTIFGTNINSMELMLETDLTKRMQMVRKELVAQGKEWDNLSVFEKNVITQTLGVDEAQAALILSSEKQRKKLEQQKKMKEADQKTNERWTKGIRSIQRTLIAWGKWIDKTMRSMTELVAAVLGFDKPAKMMGKMAKFLTQGFKDINAWLKKTTIAWREGGDELGTFGKVLKFMISAIKITAVVVGGLVVGIAKLVKWLADITGVTDLVVGAFDMVADGWSRIADLLNEGSKTIEDFLAADIDWGLVWEGFVMTAEESWSEFSGWIKGVWDGVVDNFMAAWNDPVTFFTKTIPDSFMKAMSTLWDGIKFGVETVANFFTDTWDTLTGFFPVLTGRIESVWEGVTDFFKFSIGIWKKIFTGVADFVGDMFTDPIRKIKSLWKSLSSAVSDIFDILPVPIQKALDFVGGIIGTVVDGWKAIFKGVADFVGDMFTSPIETIKRLFTSLANNVKEIFGGALEFLSDPVAGFKKGFESIKGLFGFDSADDALLADGKVTKLNPKDSVVALQDDPQKILKMLQGQLPDLSSVVESIATDASSVFGDLVPDLSGIMESIVAQMPSPEVAGEAINNVAATIATEVNSLAKAIEALAVPTAKTSQKQDSQPQIIQVNLHLDGKKISESQVKLSRNA